MSNEVQNVFDAILKYGHDEDFAPVEKDEFEATDAPAGRAKLRETIRKSGPTVRADLGYQAELAP